MRAANLGLRFLLELGALAAVGYWGWETGDGLLGWVLAIVAIAAVIAVWDAFAPSPSTVETSKQVSFAIELAVWLAAGAALYRAATQRLD